MEIPRKLMNDTALAYLDRIIEGKSTLIKKAIGADSLEYEITEDRIRFPWFTMTEDAEENKTYITFISKLVGESGTGADWSEAALNWAESSGLADGLTFSAKGSCPRSDVIYFLWRQLA